MRLYRLANQLADRFGYMDGEELRQLDAEARKWYDDQLAEANGKEKFNAAAEEEHRKNPSGKKLAPKSLNTAERVTKFAEQWWVRYLLVGLFIWLVPTIRRFMNDDPLSRDSGGNNPDSFDEFSKMYYQYRKMRGM